MKQEILKKANQLSGEICRLNKLVDLISGKEKSENSYDWSIKHLDDEIKTHIKVVLEESIKRKQEVFELL